MKALIVVAHPEPQSFNHHLARAAARALAANGAEVETSDLYAAQFDPVERPEHYGAVRADRDFFSVQNEQRSAFQRDATPADVQRELDKVRRADLLLFQYPIWWWGPPAVLKGWFDRVWVYGGLYCSTARFERGPLAGKRAMLSVTHGALASACGHDGMEGDSELVLWPTLVALRYVGLSVLSPFITHGVRDDRDDAQSSSWVDRLAHAEAALLTRLRTLSRTAEVPFNQLEDFDDEHRLLLSAPSYSPFVRHRARLDLGGPAQRVGGSHPATNATSMREA